MSIKDNWNETTPPSIKINRLILIYNKKILIDCLFK